MTPFEAFEAHMLESLKRVFCLPIIPPGQEDESEQPPMPPPPRIGGISEGFFEKRIGRLQGGPPPRGKPKPPKEPQPVLAESVEALHRAIARSR